MSYFYTVNHYVATITVGPKTYKAKTTADSPELAAQKIGVQATRKFAGQQIRVGVVEFDAVGSLKQLFNFDK